MEGFQGRLSEEKRQQPTIQETFKSVVFLLNTTLYSFPQKIFFSLFGDVVGRFWVYFWTTVGEVLGTCLGGFWRGLWDVFLRLKNL